MVNICTKMYFFIVIYDINLNELKRITRYINKKIVHNKNLCIFYLHNLIFNIKYIYIKYLREVKICLIGQKNKVMQYIKLVQI